MWKTKWKLLNLIPMGVVLLFVVFKLIDFWVFVAIAVSQIDLGITLERRK